MKDLVKVEVRKYFRTAGHGGGIFLGNGEKTFAIFIGPNELNALVLAGNGIAPARPLTHNLIDRVLSGFRLEVKRVVITKIVDDAFHAALTLEQDGHEVEFDCRPSDALVIALLRKKEIYVRRELFDEVEDGEKLLSTIREREEADASERAPARKPARKAKKTAEEREERPGSAARASRDREGQPSTNRLKKYFDVRETPGIDWSSLDFDR